MKRVSTVTTVIFLSFPLVALAAFDRDLQYGSTGSDVTELQEFLTVQEHYSGPITGNFYSLTRQAVIKFQQANNLSPAAGYFGPKSRAKANSILAEQDTASNAQAVQETGSVPVPKKDDILSAFQKQLDALLAQIQQLTAQSQTQTSIQQQTQTTLQQTQQSVQQIQQNTEPPPSAPTPPQPITIIVQAPPEPSRPYEISIKQYGPIALNTTNSKFRYVFLVRVLDQYGTPMKGIEVVMGNKKSLTILDADKPMWYAEFEYIPDIAPDPPHINVRQVTFTSGTLVKTIQLII